MFGRLLNGPAGIHPIRIRCATVLIAKNVIATQQVSAGYVKNKPVLRQVTYVGTEVLVIGRFVGIEFLDIGVKIPAAATVGIGETNLRPDRMDKIFIYEREVVTRSKTWNGGIGEINIVPLCVQERIGNPIVNILQCLIIPPEKFHAPRKPIASILEGRV